MSRCADYFRNFQNGRRCHGNGQNAKKIEKHKNDHSRLLAEHLVERDKPKNSESVGQTLPQLPWKQKRGGI